MNILTKTLLAISFLLVCCGQASQPGKSWFSSSGNDALINESGTTLQTRFNVPEGYKRTSVEPESFGAYLRGLPLKPVGSIVKYFNGAAKYEQVYDAVVDMPISNKDLQQCADAVMRLRGEYFFAQKKYDKISFTLTNGFRMDYTEWMKGKRLVVNGNKTYWKQSTVPSNTYADFRNYMEMVFSYAGTLSLSKALHSKPINELAIGDVFIIGGSPGHAVVVVDVAENTRGEKLFILAQSYMPAQETQILKNPTNPSLSPWFTVPQGQAIETPQWTFTTSQLKTW